MMAILYISDFYQSLRFTGLTNEKTVNFANAQIVKKQGTLQNTAMCLNNHILMKLKHSS